MVAVAVEGNVGEVMVEGNVVVEDTFEGKWLLSLSRATLANSWSRAMLLRTRSRGERLTIPKTYGRLVFRPGG